MRFDWNKISLYVAFAVIAISLNLASQWLFFQIYSGFLYIYFGLAIGTLVGLVTKYILDKIFIFEYTTKSYAEDAAKFLLYSFMGVWTTAIFWGFELGFYFLINTSWSKYVGGFIGLVIGYVVKYFLDRNYVFIKT